MIKTLGVHGCLFLSSISCRFIFFIWFKMSKMKTLIESTDIPEFKTVLENWDDSHSPDEAANEIAKLLKGQQPKVFLTWLIELSDQQISPGKFKLKKDIIQESVRLLGDILVEKSNEVTTTNPPHTLSCSVCASKAQQDFTKAMAGLGEDVHKIIQTFVDLKMHWICNQCKDKLENKGEVDCGAIQNDEEQTKLSDAAEDETISLREASISLKIGTDSKDEAVNHLVQTTTRTQQTQTLHKQTNNQEVQTIIQETENQEMLHELEKEQLQLVEKTSIVMESNEAVVDLIATKNNSTQTDKISEGEEEYRKKIEREVQIAYEIKMVQEKQKRSKELSKKGELKQNLELEKCQLEMEKTKLELEKHDLFVEKFDIDRFGLYRVRKTFNPKQQKDSGSDLEKKVGKLRNKLEKILDNGGDWRDTMDILKKLDDLEDLNLQILTSTKIVWTVNDIRRYSRHPEVVEFARKVVKRLNRIMPKNYRSKGKEQCKTSSKYREDFSPERNNDYREDNHKKHKSKAPSVLETIGISDSEEEKENKAKQPNKVIQNFTKSFDNLQIMDQSKKQKSESDVIHVCDVGCINGHK